ncbi:MAG: hypothetical protein ACRDTG_10480 [Pseudonocardiaceae bacterium]
MLPTLVATFALALWLLAKGSKGNEISGALSLPMTIVATAIGVLMFLYQNTPKGDKSGAPPRSLRRTLRLAALLTGIVMGTGGGVFYWTVIHKTDSPVTDQVSVTDGQGMRDGGQATIQIPGQPPQRRYLAIVLTLTNPAEVGDCVAPAQLNITPVIDGQQQQPFSVRPGDEAKIDLTTVSHRASVLVTLHIPDQSLCRVDLGVSQAVLYN